MGLIEGVGGYILGSVGTTVLAVVKGVAWLFSPTENKQAVLVGESVVDLGIASYGAYKLVTEPEQPDLWKGVHVALVLGNGGLGVYEIAKAITSPSSLGPLESWLPPRHSEGYCRSRDTA